MDLPGCRRDYAVGKDEQAARDNYEVEIQPLADSSGFRLIKLNLTAPLPEMIEATGTIPAEDGEVKLSVA